jgi:hypothetical protein
MRSGRAEKKAELPLLRQQKEVLRFREKEAQKLASGPLA